jgi:hypothetical protein
VRDADSGVVEAEAFVGADGAVVADDDLQHQARPPGRPRPLGDPVDQLRQHAPAPVGGGDVDGEDDGDVGLIGHDGTPGVPDQPARPRVGDELGQVVPGCRMPDPVPELLVRPRGRLGHRLQEGQRAVREHLDAQRPHPGGVRPAHPLHGEQRGRRRHVL